MPREPLDPRYLTPEVHRRPGAHDALPSASPTVRGFMTPAQVAALEAAGDAAAPVDVSEYAKRTELAAYVKRGQEGAGGDHGALNGLGDDDHSQYLLADGSRALSGDLAVGAGKAVDGVDIGAHTHTGAGLNGPQVAHGSLTGIGVQPHAVLDGVVDAWRGHIVAYIQALCGSNLRGLWVFNPLTGTTVSDRRGTGTAHDLTLSENASGWSPGFAGMAPYLSAALTRTWSTPDHGDFTFGNGATDTAFSIVALVNMADATNFGILSKLNVTTGNIQREWRFAVPSDKVIVIVYDNSAAAYLARTYNTVITGDEGSWHVYASSYDGGGLIGGLKIYRDGSRVDDTDRTSGSYVAMEDKAALVAPYFINASGGMSERPVGQEALIFITGQELTAANMLGLSNLLLGYAGQL